MTTPLDATALVTSQTGAADQSRRELQAKLTGLGGINGRKLSPEAQEKKLREACEGFESVFIQKMWQEMRNTIPKGGLMHGKEERFWQDMYDQELSKSMTSAGGIGLADMMYAQLSRNLVSASRSAAGASQGRAFAPEAAPLLDAPAPEAPAADAPKAQPAQAKASAQAAASIYDGAAPGVAAVAEDGQNAPAAPAAAPAVNGQTAQAVAAAAAPAAQTAGTAEEAVELNPEVERALAALRARQALHHKEEAGTAQPQGAPAAASAGAQAVAGAQHKRPAPASALELAQVARREAGDKLGSHAVRPPLHQPSPRHSADAAQQVAQPAQAEGVPAASAQAVADAESAQAPGRARNVRFSTNMSTAERNRRGLKPIRVLNVDNVGVNSKAGAGIAAYHAANEAQAAAAASAEAAQPAPLTAPVAPQAGPQVTPASAPAEAAASGNFTIPPLTAADARG
ncbi:MULTISPECIES: rod-binding protein [unclassified Desulfovibrio]|uniref:rod-binding protein n=1 Tax=unclassified Desulfovibrio TaxID=2593640 RepID=UPI0013EBEBEF|nr:MULTISPECIES: rod-binding protein [unclassified Desulfovibrio]